MISELSIYLGTVISVSALNTKRGKKGYVLVVKDQNKKSITTPNTKRRKKGYVLAVKNQNKKSITTPNTKRGKKKVMCW